MAKLSLPLYLAFALYSYVVMLSFFNLPCAGFFKISELVTVPRIVIGNWQLCPDVTLMSPVEFSPQSANSTNFGQSEAASAGDADIEPVAPAISAKAATLDNRIADSLIFKNVAYLAYNHVAIAPLRKTLGVCRRHRRDGASPNSLRPFFPDHGQVHNRLRRLFHVLAADPFEPRMKGVFAGEDVGAGQAHERQP
jgi:hypothetical protein